MDKTDNIFMGVNLENAGYSQIIYEERNVIFIGIIKSRKNFIIPVMTDSNPVKTPCIIRKSLSKLL